jgi:hypothetical protein
LLIDRLFRKNDVLPYRMCNSAVVHCLLQATCSSLVFPEFLEHTRAMHAGTWPRVGNMESAPSRPFCRCDSRKMLSSYRKINIEIAHIPKFKFEQGILRGEVNCNSNAFLDVRTCSSMFAQETQTVQQKLQCDNANSVIDAVMHDVFTGTSPNQHPSHQWSLCICSFELKMRVCACESKAFYGLQCKLQRN